ncbi:MAG: hypothetical protein CMF62_02960 [Magnetococcales bacterium]|nr:hypothetical protein [Magnetococcales bacterium]
MPIDMESEYEVEDEGEVEQQQMVPKSTHMRGTPEPSPSDGMGTRGGVSMNQESFNPQESESDYLRRKFQRRNKSPDGTFRKSSYNGAPRGNLGPSDWDEFFNKQNNLIGNSQKGTNNQFSPMEDGGSGNLADFRSDGRDPCGSNPDCHPEDLFDTDRYLPQEVNDDWFEVQPEPVSVKNRHLINVTKPVGINTIGSSNRNQSYDIRGTPACPKFVVSPFLQSSIEPDVSLKPLV